MHILYSWLEGLMWNLCKGQQTYNWVAVQQHVELSAWYEASAQKDNTASDRQPQPDHTETWNKN